MASNLSSWAAYSLAASMLQSFTDEIFPGRCLSCAIATKTHAPHIRLMFLKNLQKSTVWLPT
ncbi:MULTISPECIES: hypothetical protein [unclassified Microcoleus]|uniref:hypothetical protein n=1 Tax=unclassified Microcoleus TaxID=2642155 RepID=UPI002FD2CD76